MNLSKVATRYAESFLNDVIEKGLLEQISEEVDFVLSTIKANSKLDRFLQNPVIKSEIKKSVLNQIFTNRISDNALKFLDFVVDKNRVDILVQILQKFIELKDDYLGIVRLDVKSAFPFSDETKNLLIKKFENLFNKKIEADFSVDEKLIGGFVVKFKDTIYDASIKHQLERLKQNFITGSLSLN
ncbi:MAG: ATP synthase F1 subunit delta [Ignavibacterium sp.]|nr:ATP synthase F1 subunit delta [Ignavibacterium sp.]MCX7610653.1 ATP synthase F1 subunit delta [Ignavibacterium sp.]MDW8375543.1 ATP synthase F1 subunit delta [Ignavibacteriales bacterium]